MYLRYQIELHMYNMKQNTIYTNNFSILIGDEATMLIHTIKKSKSDHNHKQIEIKQMIIYIFSNDHTGNARNIQDNTQNATVTYSSIFI